jgi:hypothetical protein
MKWPWPITTAAKSDAIHNLQLRRKEGNNVEVQGCASNGETQDECPLESDSNFIDKLLPRFPDDGIPATQHSFIVAGGTTQDDDDNSKSMIYQSQLLINNVSWLRPVVPSLMQWLLNGAACELLEACQDAQ